MNIYICDMIHIDAKQIRNWHAKNKEQSLIGRYITLAQIEPILKKMKCEKIGMSVNKNPIYKYVLGSGPINVLIWSQMHGNESTGTKALFDIFNFFNNPIGFELLAEHILKNCSLTFIPMLNPDGAEVYTRVNANKVDLNRDAVNLSQPESKILRNALEELKPRYCFNLHDQRTIFTVGDTQNTATLSFLAPSINEKREITAGRIETMKVIVAMNKLVQKLIPGHIGRYTDEFYPTATGDNFQKMGYNTILIEAGHYKDDYTREEVRMYNFVALLQALNYISADEVTINHNDYFSIPNNTEFYLDKILKGVFLESEDKRVDVGILYNEVLIDNAIAFEPTIKFIGDASSYSADIMEDKHGLSVKNEHELKRFLKKRC